MTVQDISCVGKCSLTVALPIISAAGVEAGVLPTAVLSTHTAFPKFTFRDLTDEIEPIGDTFRDLSIDFDAVYTGYLGSFRQIELVEEFYSKLKKDKTKLIVDPAMADNGKLYYGFTPEFAARMALLASKADLIIPNITEACFMLGEEYRESYDEDYIRAILKRLTDMGASVAALTGISFETDKIGYYAYDGKTETYYFYFNEKLPVSYHGTGDIFASATVGAMMRGLSIEDSLTLATDFTLESMRYTMRDPQRRTYGVNFEEALPFYISRLCKEF
jgi:pyridoxine kinase